MVKLALEMNRSHMAMIPFVVSMETLLVTQVDDIGIQGMSKYIKYCLVRVHPNG